MAGELAQNVSLGVSIAKVAGALLVVLALMALLAYLLRKAGLDQRGMGGGGRIQVIESRMIAPKKHVSIVRVAGRFLALGVSEAQITLLAELAPEEVEENAPAPAPAFGGLLRRAMGGRTAGGEDQA